MERYPNAVKEVVIHETEWESELNISYVIKIQPIMKISVSMYIKTASIEEEKKYTVVQICQMMEINI